MILVVVVVVTQAEGICHTCIRAWQRWMLTEADQPAPALRYDFIIGRDEHGKVGPPGLVPA